jgi:hypothetical protein
LEASVNEQLQERRAAAALLEEQRARAAKASRAETASHDAASHVAAAHDDHPHHEDVYVQHPDELERVRKLSRSGWWPMPLGSWWPRVRKVAIVAGALASVAAVATGALWWRLSSGPIELDIATPWLAAAIKENFGDAYAVEVGGTQLERDTNGRTSLRIRDIVVRDGDGTVVASAPKAEVALSGTGLMRGRLRAERLSLVGAEMAVRIETNSKVTVFANGNKRPIVTALAGASSLPLATGAIPRTAGLVAPVAPPEVPAPAGPTARSGISDFAALLGWIESLDARGLDGGDLAEIGLKGGNLTVDDERNGKQWTFTNIDLGMTRPKGGGIAVTLGSEKGERPWLVRASLTPGGDGRRIVDIDAQNVSAKDLMLAMRLGTGEYEPDIPISGHIRADIGPDGVPRTLDGRIQIDKGIIIDADDPLASIAIERAEISLDWDAKRQALMMPFQVVLGGNRITLLAQFEAPRDAGGTWGLKVTGGTIVLASASQPNLKPIILDRFLLRLRVDPNTQRIEVEQGEFGNLEVGIAVSGSLDYAAADPRLALGVAGTRMSVAAMKLLWPATVAPKVRTWVEEHIANGTVERLVIAVNAPWSTLKASGPPVPDDGLSIEIASHGTEVRPVAGLPAIRDADLNVRISGRTAVVNLGRGNVELSAGRKLAITGGVFEVPDTFPPSPPAKVRFRLDGTVPAGAELLALERLRDPSGLAIDPASSRGTLTAQVTLALPLKADLPAGAATYTINLDATNFGAERLVMGQKIETALLKVSANNLGTWIRGDVKINGIPANLDYRKPRDADAEVRVQATLDETGRSKLGFNAGALLSGPVPVKLSGRVAARDGDSRLSVEADLTQARVDNLLPGWVKPHGRPARATFALINRNPGARLEDLAIDTAGVSVRGVVEVDGSGDVVSANFPVFSLSDGDKTTLRADRAPDGTLRVTLRGDVYDGRSFIKSAMTGPASHGKQKHDVKDIDLDIKLGTVAGFHGETLRGLDLRMSRRAGIITNFVLNGKLGRDTPLIGDLRGRAGSTRQVVFIETNDAGAFFRFNDVYPKIVGGEMWVALDPHSADQAPQDGILNIRDFVVRGESALDRVAGAPAGQPQSGVEFSRLRVEFTRSVGRLAIREGLVRGPVIGATVEGYIDYVAEDVRLRGTFVPLYGLNNMFGQIPIVGLFLGGSNEGLLGVTYEVVGPPGAPVLRVNPISAVAPGLLRKFFEFPSSNAPTQSHNASAPQAYATPAQPNYFDPGR